MIVASKTMSNVGQHYDLRGQQALAAERDLFSSRGNLWMHASIETELLRILRRSTRRGHLLDLCCGTGYWSLLAAAEGWQVTGVDLSGASLQAAQASARRHGLVVRWVESEALQYLREVREPFDGILISGSTYYLDRPTLFPLLETALKPSGFFVAAETNGSNKILSGYRRVRNSVSRHRDAATLSQLIPWREAESWSQQWSQSRLVPLDLLVLVASPLRVLPQATAWLHPFLRLIDQFLFKHFPLQSLSFKFLFYGEKALEKNHD